MTSVMRYKSQIGKDVPKIIGVSGPLYLDTVLNYNMLFPFTYSNGLLDLVYIDNFYNNMVAIPNKEPFSSACNPPLLSRVMGGIGMVTRIGPKFTEYLNAWLILSTQYKVHINASVTKVQTYLPSEIYSNVPFRISDNSPDSDTYPWGGVNDDYRTTWIFKSPLTLSYYNSTLNKTQYLTLQSNYNIDTC